MLVGIWAAMRVSKLRVIPLTTILRLIQYLDGPPGLMLGSIYYAILILAPILQPPIPKSFGTSVQLRCQKYQGGLH